MAVAAAGSAGLSAGLSLFLFLNKPFSLDLKSESAFGAVSSDLLARALPVQQDRASSTSERRRWLLRICSKCADEGGSGEGRQQGSGIHIRTPGILVKSLDRDSFGYLRGARTGLALRRGVQSMARRRGLSWVVVGCRGKWEVSGER